MLWNFQWNPKKLKGLFCVFKLKNIFFGTEKEIKKINKWCDKTCRQEMFGLQTIKIKCDKRFEGFDCLSKFKFM